MDRAAIEARLKELETIKAQQTERLENARREQQFALQSLERIEGARQDCTFWLEQIEQAEQAKVQAAEANGQAEAALTERN